MAQEKIEMNRSGESRALVLDANILLRAVLGTRVRSIIEQYAESVPLFITSVCVAEVREYLPLLCAKRNWDAALSLDLLGTLLTQVRVVENSFFADLEVQAKRRIGSRDIDDWPVVALALALGADIWTEDTDFFGSGLPVWTTETVDVFFDDDSWRVNEAPVRGYSQHCDSLLDDIGV